MQFYETSAKDESCSRGVEKAFENVAKKVLNKHSESAKARSSSDVEVIERTESTIENIYVDEINIHQHNHEHIVKLTREDKNEDKKSTCCSL